MSEFERQYKLLQERCIEENGALYEVYDEFQLKNTCEYFYGLGENSKIKKLESIIELYKKSNDFYGDTENWDMEIINSDGEELDRNLNDYFGDFIGGKLARETARLVNELIGDTE